MIEVGLPRMLVEGRDPRPTPAFVVISPEREIIAAFPDPYTAKALAQERSHETKTEFVVRPGLIASGSLEVNP